MNSTKNIIVGFALLVSLLAMLETAQAAETMNDHLRDPCPMLPEDLAEL